MPKRLTIEEMQKLAESRGGRCLSTIYVNNRTKLKWQCKEGHIWEATADNIKAGKWCRICGIKRAANKKRLTINDMQNEALEKRGRCISEKYTDAHTKLEFECEFGHRFWMSPNTVNMGHWCRQCSIAKVANSRKLTLKMVQDIAEKRASNC